MGAAPRAPSPRNTMSRAGRGCTARGTRNSQQRAFMNTHRKVLFDVLALQADLIDEWALFPRKSESGQHWRSLRGTFFALTSFTRRKVVSTWTESDCRGQR